MKARDSISELATPQAPREPAPAVEMRQPPAGLSLRSNFAWVLSGNLVFAACQWGIIVALAKLGSALMVGQFSLGLAIATPVLMFTNLYLRAVQATDARRAYRFGEYFQLRITMTVIGLMIIAAIALFGDYGRATLMVVLAVALAKGIETLSDIHYGLFQLHDRLDQTGRSLMLRGVLAVAALSAALYITHDVLWACAALVLAWLLSLLVFDFRRGRRFAPPSRESTNWRRQWSLARMALPLGIVTTISAVNLNMPRYFIHARMGDRQLGIYSAMAYATVAVTLVSDSLGHSAIPRLSRMYAGGQMQEFRSLLLKLVFVGLALGTPVSRAAHAFGKPLLRTLLQPRVRGSFARLHASDGCNRNPLCSGGLHKRHHVRALLSDSSASIRHDGGGQCPGLRVLDSAVRPGRRRHGSDGLVRTAISARRRPFWRGWCCGPTVPLKPPDMRLATDRWEPGL